MLSSPSSAKHWSDEVNRPTKLSSSPTSSKSEERPPKHLHLSKNPTALTLRKDRAWEEKNHLQLTLPLPDLVRGGRSTLLEKGTPAEKEEASKTVDFPSNGRAGSEGSTTRKQLYEGKKVPNRGIHHSPPRYEPSILLDGFEEDDVEGLRQAYYAAQERIRELEMKTREPTGALSKSGTETKDTTQSDYPDHPSKLQYVQLRRELHTLKETNMRHEKVASMQREESSKDLQEALQGIEKTKHRYKDLKRLYQKLAEEHDSLLAEKEIGNELVQNLKKDYEKDRERLTKLERMCAELEVEKKELSRKKNTASGQTSSPTACGQFGAAKSEFVKRSSTVIRKPTHFCFPFASCMPDPGPPPVKPSSSKKELT